MPHVDVVVNSIGTEAGGETKEDSTFNANFEQLFGGTMKGFRQTPAQGNNPFESLRNWDKALPDWRPPRKPPVVDIGMILHVATRPSNSTEAVSSIEEHEPGPLPDVALLGSNSPLLEEPSEENRKVIDVPSSENWAWIMITEAQVWPSKAVSDLSSQAKGPFSTRRGRSFVVIQ